MNDVEVKHKAKRIDLEIKALQEKITEMILNEETKHNEHWNRAILKLIEARQSLERIK